MDHNSMIEVIQGHRDGKQIEFRRPAATEWNPIPPHGVFSGFDFQAFNYRVKPEPPKPKEFWVVDAMKPSAFHTERDAQDFLEGCARGVKIFHVSEVL